MERRLRILLLCLLAAALACNTLAPRPTPAPSAPPTAAQVPTATRAAPPPTSTQLPTATAAPASTAAPSATSDMLSRADLYIAAGDVLVHPDPQVYAGDKVSFEIFAHDGAGLGLRNFPVALYRGAPRAENRLAVQPAFGYGLGERLEAAFTWTWDTTGLSGEQTLTAVLDPNDEVKKGDENKSNNSLTFTVDVLPRAELPPAERDARWATASSGCCLFHYITGSAAERDLAAIETTADAALAYVQARLGRTLKRKIEFNLIDRLLGHGGFASDTVTISYLDRDYAGSSLENVFRHEAAHLLNRGFGDYRPALIEEGTATYVAGGHFKTEPFQPRLAGLLALGRYIPLRELADDFYNSQHEIGYLEGAAFIDYLVTTYGWRDFSTLLGAFQKADTQSASLDGGLRLVYDKSLAQLEAEWLARARLQPADPRWQADVELTIAYYDSVRRYQQADDPSAYFLTAWTPDIGKAVRENITADYDRHPDRAENIALETLMIDASRALDAADFESVRADLDAVNAVLDAGGDFAASELAGAYLSVTRTLLAAGYEPQQISLKNDLAAVSASRSGASVALVKLRLVYTNGGWQVN